MAGFVEQDSWVWVGKQIKNFEIRNSKFLISPRHGVTVTFTVDVAMPPAAFVTVSVYTVDVVGATVTATPLGTLIDTPFWLFVMTPVPPA